MQYHLQEHRTRARASHGAPGLDRRTFFKLAAAGAGGALIGAAPSIIAGDEDEPSRPVRPFVDELPIPPRKQAVASNIAVSKIANLDDGECGRDELEFLDDAPPQKLYELEVKEGRHRWHRDYPEQAIVGYDGRYPGPTFDEDYGVPIVVRLFNRLQAGQGFGVPEISMHLHNMHTSSESDGFPSDYFSSRNAGPTLRAPGVYKDHHYMNFRSGFERERDTFGDPRESLGTLWYHDHCMDFTSANVYGGLAGMYRIFDELDTGVETTGLRLPAGDYDVPLILADRRFTRDGYLRFDPLETDGLIGDRYTVNGKIQPKFSVHRRRYRLRILNTGPSRVYQIALVRGRSRQGFTYIANDGNLLPNPIVGMTDVMLGAAERADIVIDFSAYPAGTRLYLVNRLEQKDGRRPTGKVLSPGERIMRFDVGGDPPTPDLSAPLTATTALRPLPEIDLSKVERRRTFEFERSNGAWVINDRFFDPLKPLVEVKEGDAEIWRLVNTSGNWWHPIHIHLEEGRILSRNGRTPPPHERGRKDVYLLRQGEWVDVYLHFRDCKGKYPIHCHNTSHEDHAMMARWDVV